MPWKKHLIVIAVLFLMANALPVVADDDGMQRASGAARISFIFGGLVVDRYEFSAVHHSDGRVTGRFNFRSKYDDEDIGYIMDPAFWKMIAERRKEPTIPFEVIKRDLEEREKAERRSASKAATSKRNSGKRNRSAA